MRINEKLKRTDFRYAGSRKEYTIHDPTPDVMILDKNYKGDSILGYNLNYYKGDKDELKTRVDRLLKKEVKIFHKKKKLKRYQALKEQFPFLSRFIRRYKKSAITKYETGK